MQRNLLGPGDEGPHQAGDCRQRMGGGTAGECAEQEGFRQQNGGGAACGRRAERELRGAVDAAGNEPGAVLEIDRAHAAADEHRRKQKPGRRVADRAHRDAGGEEAENADLQEHRGEAAR